MTRRTTPRQVFEGGPLDGTSVDRPGRGRRPVYMTGEGGPLLPRIGDRVMSLAGIRPALAPLRSARVSVRACYYAAESRFDPTTGDPIRVYRWVDLDDDPLTSGATAAPDTTKE